MTKPVSVAFVLPDLAGGGAQRVMMSLAGALDRSRFSVRLLVVGGDQTLAGDVPQHVGFENGGATRLRHGLPWLVRRLRALKPDCVVSVMGYLNLALLMSKPLLPVGTRIIVREANAVSSTVRAMPKWLPAARLYTQFYPKASAIVSPTQTIANDIAQIAPCASGRIHVIPNPVNVSRLRERAKVSRRVEGPGLRLVCAGRMTHQKGFDRLIALAPMLPADSHISIFGGGPLEKNLQAQIDKLGLQNRVSLRGYTNDLQAWVAGADAFLLPSRWEGLPNVVLESLAVGTPAIVSDEALVQELAAVAPDGAVTVCPVGDRFVAAVNSLAPRISSDDPVRDCLLPLDHRIDAVAERWQDMLRQLVETNDGEASKT